MKNIKVIIVLLLVIFIGVGCNNFKKLAKDNYKYELFIDYKYVCYQGENLSQHLTLYIDSIDGMRFKGRLIIQNSDTLILSGFEKGNLYPTSYYSHHIKKDGLLFIDMYNDPYSIADSISIRDIENESSIIKEKITLYRSPRCIN